MERPYITPAVHTPFADLDLLLSEAESIPVAPPDGADGPAEPETVDVFDAQILAGLVSP